ncbi:hypothetical protein ACIBHX_23985 [Nonomuraea sp. NPDC050536]|uniref:DUF7064 domain-containing protein n=1 Tax=Nonomuraea sp. NPDC050536 TaxID=3364366 RepID=UPI0037C5BF8A
MDSEPHAAGEPPADVHRPGTDRLWGESWYFDFAAADGTAGGFVRVGDYPHLGRRWYWAYVVAGDRAGGHALDLPLTGRREVPWRATDPALGFLVEPGGDGWRITAGGDGFRLDLTWREQAPAYGYTRGNRMEQPGWAVGEVSLDGESLPLVGPGQRDHSWGVRDWWRIGWTWCAGRLSDGTRFQATHLDTRGRIPPDGYLMAPDGSAQPVREVAVGTDTLRIDDTLLEFTDVAHVTIDLRSPDGGLSRLHRAMTRVRAGTTRHGIGWRERNVPERAAGRV